MKVLKFGGTSVANANSLEKVIAIINQQKDTRMVVVVSALGGITDLLMQMAQEASRGIESYKAPLSTIEKRHLEPIQAFIPLKSQSGIISFLKAHLNELETLLESIFLFCVLTDKNIAMISS